MQIASVRIVGFVLASTLLLGGCLHAEKEGREVSTPTLKCFDLRDGYGVPLCVTSFTRILADPDLFLERHVAFTGVLSVEFQSCVLHRDHFSSSHQVDMESLIIEDPTCFARARDILGDKPTAVVNVLGQYVVGTGNDNVERAGKLVDLRLLEVQVVVGR